jgi:fucose permease
MNWLHASYSLGAMLGPIIMTACIANAASWRMGYLIVASTLLVLAFLFLLTRSRWTDSPAAREEASTLGESLHEPPTLPHPEASGGSSGPVSAASALRNRVVQISIVLFFIYTGLEVAIGQWSFTVLTESRGVQAETAGAWVAIYWASILIGRIIFGFVVDRISIDLLIRWSLATALSGAALFVWNPFLRSAPVALALCGLGLAVIFPCLMTRTPQRLGKDLAAHAIGFQVGSAMLGAAALPSLCGLIAQHANLNLVGPTFFVIATALLFLHELLLSKTLD